MVATSGSARPRVIAVDWSGAQRGAHARIWLAEAEAGGSLVRLECGRDRDAIADHLIAEAERDPAFAVGLDFAFSLPAWFLEERGLRSAHELWALAGREGEGWLARCAPPFWGRPGRGRPDLGDPARHTRRTERALSGRAGLRPKSVFQIGGAGSVGTGSLRGMPILARLHAAGFWIWPFPPPPGPGPGRRRSWPRVVEIYPRAFTGPVRKSDPRARAAALRGLGLAPAVRRRAAGSEDAFDAALSALAMAGSARALASLAPSEDPVERLEGAIWLTHPEPPPASADTR